MFEIPLFPLNTVLFPGAPLQLHIFEERYKRMIGMCIEKQQEFGVVLIRKGAEALGPSAEPHPIGCTATIIHVQRLDEGRMNIVALGQERFRILSVDHRAHPYLVGSVDAYPLVNDQPQELSQPVQRLRAMLDRFIQELMEAGGEKLERYQLPEDPIALAYMAAAVLQIPPTQKQELLVLENASDLLMRLQTIYRRELSLLKATISRSGDGPEVPFSRN